MKKKIYNNVIIGSGPSAIGALYSLKGNNNAIITGYTNETNNLISLNPIHTKLTYEEDNQINFISNLFEKNNDKLFTISKIGGFGNYWGQGSEYVPYEKLKNKKIFKNKKEYLLILKKIYNLFKIYRNNKSFKLNEFIFYPSPILKNSPNKNNTKLKSFYFAFKYLIKKKNINVIDFFVRKIHQSKNYIIIELSNNKKIQAKKVFMAGNVLGNANILFNSDKNIKKISFFDDCPLMIYSITLNSNLIKFSKSFYSLITRGKKNFISCINLSNIGIGFLFYFFFGFKLKILDKFKIKLINIFNFFQIWNETTKRKAFIYRDGSFSVSKKKTNISSFNNFINTLKRNKIYPFKIELTPFGSGFHYHNLQIYRNSNPNFLDNYLDKKFNKKVVCIDSSSEKYVNPGPFTITQMCIAFKKIS